jgi:hypothetical protein
MWRLALHAGCALSYSLTMLACRAPSNSTATARNGGMLCPGRQLGVVKYLAERYDLTDPRLAFLGASAGSLMVVLAACGVPAGEAPSNPAFKGRHVREPQCPLVRRQTTQILYSNSRPTSVSARLETRSSRTHGWPHAQYESGAAPCQCNCMPCPTAASSACSSLCLQCRFPPAAGLRFAPSVPQLPHVDPHVCLPCCADDALAGAHRLALEHGIFERPLGVAGIWGTIIRAWLDDLLPPDAVELCSGRVRLVVTEVGFSRCRSSSAL